MIDSMPDNWVEVFVTPWFDGKFQPHPAQTTLLDVDTLDEDELCPICGAYWECDCLEES